MPLTCPGCATRISGHGGLACLPIGRALSLVGGLALVAAYFMPWFGVQVQGQGITLSGEFLGRFLARADPAEVGRVVPGLAGSPNELLALRALVCRFPSTGGLAARLAVLATLRPALRRPLDVVLALVGLVPLIAVIAGLGFLPPGARPQPGLWTIGAGAVAILLGLALDLALRDRATVTARALRTQHSALSTQD